MALEVRARLARLQRGVSAQLLRGCVALSGGLSIPHPLADCPQLFDFTPVQALARRLPGMKRRDAAAHRRERRGAVMPMPSAVPARGLGTRLHGHQRLPKLKKYFQ